MAGPAARQLDGSFFAWGHKVASRQTFGAVTASTTTIYNPPLKALYCGGAGNVTIVLDGDDETNSANYSVIAVVAGQILDQFAIRQVRVSTATGLIGFY